MCVTKAKLRSYIEEERKHAKVLERVMENNDRMITTILIGNNVVNLSASALTTVFTMRITNKDVYVSLATGILTLTVLIFCEIVPKTSARRNYDTMALRVAPAIRFLMIVLFPISFIIEKFASFIMLLRGQKDASADAITENELRSYVDVSQEDGVIEQDEKKYINNVMDFRISVARDIMIPRIDMISIPVNAKYREVIKVFRETMYTRIPVYQDEKENIIGFMNIKDLIRLKDEASFSVSNYLREGYYTYEFKKTNDLMYEMRKQGMSLAFVNNEYGDTVGMVTLEDLLEEIVGEIRDEYDADEAGQIEERGDSYLIEAKMKLEDINDELGTSFESEDYDTIGGLVLDQLDRIPEDHETVTLSDGTVLKVMGIRQNRIVKVLVTLPELSEDEVTEDNKTGDLSDKEENR